MNTSHENNQPLLTVSQLTHAIKLQLESTFPVIMLQAEISNFKIQTSGHLYFTLKDNQSQISAVMFKGDAGLMRVVPKDGSHVIIKGEINVYPPSGKYQIVVRELRLMGVGELLLKLEELKIKLHQLGYFRSGRKRKLPTNPKTIGVITSPTGAVIQDIINVLTRRYSGFHLILNPVKVQGEGAAKEISQAIKFFNETNLVDVMIIGRGGGSIEDLWAFNEEIVAEAIYTSRIPIISAVGHETDHCIADYVADVRAPTPSAAAEIVIAEKNHQLSRLEQYRQRIQQCLQHKIIQRKQQIAGVLRLSMFSTPYAFLGQWMQKLDDYREKFELKICSTIHNCTMKLEAAQKQSLALRPHAKVFHYRQRLFQLQRSIEHAWSIRHHHRRRQFSEEIKRRLSDQSIQKIISHKKERLMLLTETIASIDPKNLLRKGYAILFSEKDKSVITSIQTIENKQTIRVLLGDGELLTQVKDIILSDTAG